MRHLQQLTTQVTLDNKRSDVWKCVWGGSSTSSKFYSFCFRNERVDEVFSWISKTKCNMKWKVFSWLLMVDRVNTRNMLKRRQFVLADDDYSFMMCPTPPEETLVHLFYQCPFASTCWSALGISWPTHGNRFEIMHAGRRSWRLPMFMEVFVVAAWGIWKERNDKLFRGIPPSLCSWKAQFKEDFSLLVHRSPQRESAFITSFADSL